jgi:polyphosphate kinase 2 (PPK2 family)
MVVSLVLRPGTSLDLAQREPDPTTGAPGDRAETEAVFAAQHLRLADLQERRFAEGKRGLLVVLQALDTAGEVVVFNRSHYEDVIVTRVHDLVPRPCHPGALRAHQCLRASPARRGHPDREDPAPHLL